VIVKAAGEAALAFRADESARPVNESDGTSLGFWLPLPLASPWLVKRLALRIIGAKALIGSAPQQQRFGLGFHLLRFHGFQESAHLAFIDPFTGIALAR
jgi:hypothetical protein